VGGRPRGTEGCASIPAAGRVPARSTQRQATPWAAMVMAAGLGVQPSSTLFLPLPLSGAAAGPWQLCPSARPRDPSVAGEGCPAELGQGAREVAFPSLSSRSSLLHCHRGDLSEKRMSIFCRPKMKAVPMAGLGGRPQAADCRDQPSGTGLSQRRVPSQSTPEPSCPPHPG